MPTVKDVAKRAAVSPITVSRVVNNRTGVSEETRARVLQAIEELAYTPHLSAQRLRRGRSEVLALLLPRIESPYAGMLLRSVLDEARARGRYVLVLEADLDDEADREYVQQALAYNRVDGLITAPPGGDSDALLDFLRLNHIRYVAITPKDLAQHALVIEARDREGALEATRYLISMGHRRVGHIACLECERFSQERLAGYTAALAEARIPALPELIAPGDNSTRGGYNAALALLDLPDPPTAIFAGNDEMAVGVTIALWHQGLRIPQDVSVMGFDDAPVVRETLPFLTTVYQPVDQIARASVSLLVNTSRTGARTHLRIPTRLVIRHSCAPPRQGALVRRPIHLSPFENEL